MDSLYSIEIEKMYSDSSFLMYSDSGASKLNGFLNPEKSLSAKSVCLLIFYMFLSKIMHVIGAFLKVGSLPMSSCIFMMGEVLRGVLISFTTC